MDVALVFLSATLDRVAKFDWKRLIPKFRVDHYRYGVLAVEPTWRVGLGIGLGLGRVDLWFGWPRQEESLHTAECHHEPIAKPVEG